MTVEAVNPSPILDGVSDPRIARLLDHPIFEQIEVFNTREGRVDCVVPTDVIDHEEVPVRNDWAQELARQMREEAEGDGTGQHTALDLVLIEGEDKLRIADGFHRDAALEINSQETRYATVKLATWDELYDFRILTAKDHVHVRFSRVVQWIREVWQYSGVADRMTVEQAVLLYRHNTPGTRLGLEAEEVEAAKAWVARKEHQWGMAAMTIHSHLKVAEHVDPSLVHSTREKKSGHALEAPTQTILKIFSDELPDNFDFQNLIMEAAKQYNLGGPEVRSLCAKVQDCETVGEAQDLIDGIDWGTWEPEYGESKQRALRRAYDPRYKGASVLDKATSDIKSIVSRIDQFYERGEEMTEEMAERVRQAHGRVNSLLQDLGKLGAKLSRMADVGPRPAVAPNRPPIPKRVEPSAPVAPAKLAVVQDTAPSPAPHAPEKSTRQHSDFGQQLIDYLNGQSEEWGFIDTPAQLRAAERIAIGGSFSGDLVRREEVMEEINEARARLRRR